MDRAIFSSHANAKLRHDSNKNVTYAPDLAEKLMLWKQAFRTKIWDQDRKAVGRGPTPEAAQDAAERVWVAEGQRAYEANRDPGDAL